MTIIGVEGKGNVSRDGGRPQSGYITTTELARLCGVSRFTIINWTRQGKIKATRTVGRHYRIPVSEALCLLRTFGRENQSLSANTGRYTDGKCGNCAIRDKSGKQVKSKKKTVLYAFGYGIGRGVQALKRSKIK